MYKIIYGENKPLYNPQIDELAILNPILTLEENSCGTFEFQVPDFHPAYDDISNRITVITIFRDEEIIFKGIPVKINTIFNKTKQVYCEGLLTYLNDTYQRPARYQGVTVLELITAFINQHNKAVATDKQFEIGNVTVTDPNNYIYCYTNYDTTMQSLKEDLIDDLGGILRVRYENGKNYIDYLKDSPRTSTQVIKLGKNLIDYKSNLDSTDIATVVIPLGAKMDTSSVEGLEERLSIKDINSGLDYVTNEDAFSYYGRVEKTVIWDDVTNAENLKRKAEAYANENQYENISIEAKAIDLSLSNTSIQSFMISDDIKVISQPHGLNKYFHLTKMVLHLVTPEQDTFTLGKTVKKGLSAKMNTSNSELIKKIEAMPTTEGVLAQAINQATAMIAGAQGGFVVLDIDEESQQPYRILIMDKAEKEQAVNVIQINKNGIGFSTSGINGPYKNAWTIDGKLVADFITTGNLVSLNINNGNGTFSVDENGEMKATKGSIAGWNINKSAIYKDIVDSSNTNTVYRVYLQPPLQSVPDSTWILSCQKSTDGGTTFTGNFVLYSDGSAQFGAGKTKIKPDGSASFANGNFSINSDGTISVTGTNGVDASIDLANGKTLYFRNGICIQIA